MKSKKPDLPIDYLIEARDRAREIHKIDHPGKLILNRYSGEAFATVKTPHGKLTACVWKHSFRTSTEWRAEYELNGKMISINEARELGLTAPEPLSVLDAVIADIAERRRVGTEEARRIYTKKSAATKRGLCRLEIERRERSAAR